MPPPRFSHVVQGLNDRPQCNKFAYTIGGIALRCTLGLTPPCSFGVAELALGLGGVQRERLKKKA